MLIVETTVLGVYMVVTLIMHFLFFLRSMRKIFVSGIYLRIEFLSIYEFYLTSTFCLLGLLCPFSANIKIKIVTNEDTISKLASDSKTDFLTDETATQFKDMLVNMLVS